jgi:hypothetical protein
MAITYPLALPTQTGIASVSLRANDTVGVNMSPFSARQQVYKYNSQFWEADITLPRMKREDAEYWITFLMKLNGAYGTFLLGDPAASTARGVATGSPVVNGASQTGYELITDGWTADTTGIMKAGDYIQLGSGETARLYKVLDDVDSDGSGNATLTIWPNLRSSPDDDATITVSNPKGVFRLSTNVTEFNVNEASIYGLSFGALEAL